MNFKYRLDRFDKIDKHEIISETDQFLGFFYEYTDKKVVSLEKKISTYAIWFDTFNEAKEFAIDRKNERVKLLKFELKNTYFGIKRLTLLKEDDL